MIKNIPIIKHEEHLCEVLSELVDRAEISGASGYIAVDMNGDCYEYNLAPHWIEALGVWSKHPDDKGGPARRLFRIQIDAPYQAKFLVTEIA